MSDIRSRFRFENTTIRYDHRKKLPVLGYISPWRMYDPMPLLNGRKKYTEETTWFQFQDGTRGAWGRCKTPSTNLIVAMVDQYYCTDVCDDH